MTAPSIKEALERAITTYNEVWNGWPGIDTSNVDECREDAMKAALATLSPPACDERREAIAVKPLEWDRENATAHVPETWRAESIGRKYDIQRTGDGKFDLWSDTGTAMTVEATLEAAKTAAQADYENRVRSVILASGLVQDEAGWQPISTAPKDGTEIIGCFCNDYGYQEKPTVYGPWTIAWDGKKWRSSWDDCEVISSESDFGTEYKDPDIEPTHWQPLPAPPIRSARDGGAGS